MKAILVNGTKVEINPQEIYHASFDDNVIILDVGKRKGNSTCYLCKSLSV